MINANTAQMWQKNINDYNKFWSNKKPLLYTGFDVGQITPAECAFHGLDVSNAEISAFSFEDAKIKIAGLFDGENDNDSFISTNKIQLIGGVVLLVIIISLLMRTL